MHGDENRRRERVLGEGRGGVGGGPELAAGAGLPPPLSYRVVIVVPILAALCRLGRLFFGEQAGQQLDVTRLRRIVEDAAIGLFCEFSGELDW